MSVLNFLLSKAKTALGYQQSFEELLEAGNVSDALALMSCDNSQ